MLYRGTTPYHSFTLPLNAEDITEIYITYMQNNNIIIEKSIDDITLENIDNTEDSMIEFNIDNSTSIESACTATVHLTQEDTLGFKFWPAAEKNIAVIQIRILDDNGEAYVSEPIHERIYGALKEGVI